jgi:hypothetical protein
VTILRQNAELRKDRIWNFSIPAWYAVLSDGSRFMTCPHAGPCAQVCYARNGTYRFPKVLASHTRNLETYLADPAGWVRTLAMELSSRRFRPTGEPRNLGTLPDSWLTAWAENGGAAVRIHDTGDFFSEAYLRDWLEIARRVPDVLFYAYTKEVSLFRSVPEVNSLPNFRFLFSTGGLEDHLIDTETDRHADVFPDEHAIVEAGYFSQSETDLLAVVAPATRIGIPANNIPAFRKKLAGRRFSDLTSERVVALRRRTNPA